VKHREFLKRAGVILHLRLFRSIIYLLRNYAYIVKNKSVTMSINEPILSIALLSIIATAVFNKKKFRRFIR
jgi:hypothetical protein